MTFCTEAGVDVVEALRKGELDLALDRLPSEDAVSENGELFASTLIRERQCVLVGDKDPFAARSTLSIKDMQGCTMISGLEDSAEDRTMKNALRKYHISVKRVYRTDGIDTSMQLVRDGMGIAMGPASFADYFRIKAVPLEPETWISLQFICLHSSLNHPEIKRFRDYLARLCAPSEDVVYP